MSSLREEGSPRESIEIDKNTLYTHNAYNAYNNNSEKRVNHCVRYKPSTHRAVKDYCGGDMTFGQFFEEAAVLFMHLNQKDGVIVNIEKPERYRQNDLQVKVQNLICTDDLKLFIAEVDTLDHGNVVMMQSKKRKLAKILKECYKIKEWNTELSALAEKAMSYFG